MALGAFRRITLRDAGWRPYHLANPLQGQMRPLAGADGGKLPGETRTAAAAAEEGNALPSHTWTGFGILLIGVLALLGTELALTLAIPGINYAGADGKAAQAIILATLEFAKPFHISNLNPLEGLGSQMMPMNVWANPAYWPFAFFDKQVAAEISGLVAFVCYASAVYAMARCFDLPRVPSIAAAQIALTLFGPATLALGFAVVYVSIPGLAVVYAPHLLAFGLLARLSPQRPQVFLIGGAIFALLVYSLYCDPLWTMVSGIAWIVPFAVVAFTAPSGRVAQQVPEPRPAPSPLVGEGRRRGVALGPAVGAKRILHDPHPQPLPKRIRVYPSSSTRMAKVGKIRLWLGRGATPSQREAILVRCGVLGACVALLLLSGALEYAYSLSQYTARVQFPDLLRRAPDAVYASAVVSSKYARYFYYACVPGWALAIALLRGRPRTLVLAAIISGLALTAYAAAFLALGGNWPLPLPLYLEHALFPLFWTAAIAGYWGGVEALVARGGRVSRFSARQAAAGMALVALAAVCILPVLTVARVLKYPPATMRYWQEPWPDQPEIREFLGRSIGLRDDRRFRGSALFYTNQYDEFLTIDSLWAAGVPTLNEYSQLVTPQSVYFIHQLLGRDLTTELNWFRPWSGNGDFALLFQTLRALGVRHVIGYAQLPPAETAHLASIALPRRPRDAGAGEWLVYELGDVNDGSYSPVRVTVARSAAETVDGLRAADFDFSKQVVLSAPIEASLVPARDARMSFVRGGLHISAQSDGTSLAAPAAAVLPLPTRA